MTDEERKEKRRAASAAYYAANKEKRQAVKAAWKKRNPEKVKEQNARWYAGYKEKGTQVADRRNARRKQRMAEDPIYAMTQRIRKRIDSALRNAGFAKNTRTEKMLGCTFKQFTKHIEKQFADGMSWSNRAEWHLDHIVPLSCATTIEGLEKLSHYTNIRPLWAADNLLKSNNLVLI